MEAKDAILVGCEVLCLGFKGSDYVICPLPFEEQKTCKMRLQYEAGMKEVVEWMKSRMWGYGDITEETTFKVIFGEGEWQAQLKEWGINI